MFEYRCKKCIKIKLVDEFLMICFIGCWIVLLKEKEKIMWKEDICRE